MGEGFRREMEAVNAALKMEEWATSQRMQATSQRWNGKELDFDVELPEGR